jgi:hypothetical protein
MLVEPPDRLPLRTSIAAREEPRRLDPGVQRLRLVGMARRQVPDRLERLAARRRLMVRCLGQ